VHSPSFDEFLGEVETDPLVVGLVLGGSRGKGALVDDRSDHDLYVVLDDGADLDAYAERYPTRHGDPAEVMLLSRSGLERIPAWNRYTFCHVEPLLDRSDGWLLDALRALSTVDPATAAEPLDAYVNALYRSLRNGERGLATAALLDAAQSVPWFLEFLFAAHGRVRPYNKWLAWELEQHPLPPLEPSNRLLLGSNELLPRLERIVRTGDPDGQRALFRDAEALARRLGHGPTIDSWEPDLARLRGS
jgi:hypothetical protein